MTARRPPEPQRRKKMQEKTSNTVSKTIVGWRELIDLPEWDLFGIRAKSDTGARSSAIDVDHLEELPGDRVRFEVVASRDRTDRRRMVEAPVVRRTRVRSSNGDHHDRMFVQTTLKLAGVSFQTEIGLVSRENMISRMLLGRSSLEGLFIVDPSRRYIHGSKVRKRAKDPSSS